MTKIALIGIGNMFRKDDAVGIHIARKLQDVSGEHIDIIEASGEGTELINAWADYQLVYIFDAVMNQGETGRIYRLEASKERFPTDFFKYSSHAFSLAEAVELSRILDKLPDKLIVFGVEGSDYGFGEELSEKVAQASERVVLQVIEELSLLHKK